MFHFTMLVVFEHESMSCMNEPIYIEINCDFKVNNFECNIAFIIECDSAAIMNAILCRFSVNYSSVY